MLNPLAIIKAREAFARGSLDRFHKQKASDLQAYYGVNRSKTPSLGSTLTATPHATGLLVHQELEGGGFGSNLRQQQWKVVDKVRAVQAEKAAQNDEYTPQAAQILGQSAKSITTLGVPGMPTGAADEVVIQNLQDLIAFFNGTVFTQSSVYSKTKSVADVIDAAMVGRALSYRTAEEAYNLIVQVLTLASTQLQTQNSYASAVATTALDPIRVKLQAYLINRNLTENPSVQTYVGPNLAPLPFNPRQVPAAAASPAGPAALVPPPGRQPGGRPGGEPGGGPGGGPPIGPHLPFDIPPRPMPPPDLPVAPINAPSRFQFDIDINRWTGSPPVDDPARRPEPPAGTLINPRVPPPGGRVAAEGSLTMAQLRRYAARFGAAAAAAYAGYQGLTMFQTAGGVAPAPGAVDAPGLDLGLAQQNGSAVSPLPNATQGTQRIVEISATAGKQPFVPGEAVARQEDNVAGHITNQAQPGAVGLAAADRTADADEDQENAIAIHEAWRRRQREAADQQDRERRGRRPRGFAAGSAGDDGVNYDGQPAQDTVGGQPPADSVLPQRAPQDLGRMPAPMNNSRPGGAGAGAAAEAPAAAEAAPIQESRKRARRAAPDPVPEEDMARVRDAGGAEANRTGIPGVDNLPGQGIGASVAGGLILLGALAGKEPAGGRNRKRKDSEDSDGTMVTANGDSAGNTRTATPATTRRGSTAGAPVAGIGPLRSPAAPAINDRARFYNPANGWPGVPDAIAFGDLASRRARARVIYEEWREGPGRVGNRKRPHSAAAFKLFYQTYANELAGMNLKPTSETPAAYQTALGGGIVEDEDAETSKPSPSKKTKVGEEAEKRFKTMLDRLDKGSVAE